jgi:hypothetical protein
MSDRNMFRNIPKRLRENRNGTTVPRGVSVSVEQWGPISHNPRTLIVTCSECQAGTVNETNAMRRHGWRESSVGRHRRYLCGRCARR